MKIFGKNPSGAHLNSIKESPQYKLGSFINQSKTNTFANGVKPIELVKDLFKTNLNRIPSSPIASIKQNITTNQKGIYYYWFGHSSYLLIINGFKILIDPVFSGYASPFSFSIKAFKGSNIYSAEDIGPVDLLIITHDHYDHLDYETILKLKKQTSKIVCPLGVGSHLNYWGVNSDLINEIDWWKDIKINNDLHITATPARHFSGRGFKRAQTLWCSFVLQTPYGNIFIGGDSGYDKHFKEINKSFNGFKVAFLECGQYNTKWPYIHMHPEETVEAAIDLEAYYLLPIHWGKFALAYHAWNEPAKKIKVIAREKGINVSIPKIGEEVNLENILPLNEWWND
jgi:L-ascorbate metabolism protein UlaG (beta-lactamase superfamily)